MAAQVDTSAFTITELTGQGRSVRLSGRALPYRPLEMEDVQRLTTTWMQGSPEGINTIMGAEVSPTTINGKWCDKFIAATGDNGYTNPLRPATVDGRIVANVRELVDVMRSVCRSGQEVEVVWAHLTYRGNVSKFKHTWLNVHDVEWSVDFAWTSDGSTVGPAAFRQAATSQDSTSVMQAQRDELVETIQPPFDLSIDVEFVTEITDEISEVNTSVEQATNAVAGQAIQSNTASDTARRVTAVANGVIAHTDTIVRTIDSQPARTRVFGETPDTISLGTILRAEKYQRAIRTKSIELKQTAVETAARLGMTLAPELLAIYKPITGEDLRDVSRKFYGTSFEWRRLLHFNILDSSLLTNKQTLLIPRLEGQVSH